MLHRLSMAQVAEAHTGAVKHSWATDMVSGILRVVSWNIRAGGGRRVEGIAEQLSAWDPDVVALSEFRGTPPGRWLGSALARQGYGYQRSTVDPAAPAANRLLVAARWPLELVRARTAPAEPGRWLLVRVRAGCPLVLGAMHVPNRVTRRKYPFHEAVVRFARSWRGQPGLLVGDTNTGRIGLDEEVPGFNQREEQWMLALEAAGWPDAFRYLHGEARAYTWYSPNGRNGFRLDEAFIQRRLLPRLAGVRYEWGASSHSSARRDALSDHAAIIVDLHT